MNEAGQQMSGVGIGMMAATARRSDMHGSGAISRPTPSAVPQGSRLEMLVSQMRGELNLAVSAHSRLEQIIVKIGGSVAPVPQQAGVSNAVRSGHLTELEDLSESLRVVGSMIHRNLDQLDELIG